MRLLLVVMVGTLLSGCAMNTTQNKRLCLSDDGTFEPCPITEFAKVKRGATPVAISHDIDSEFVVDNQFQRYIPRVDNKRLAHYVEQLAMQLVITEHQEQLQGDIAIATFVNFDGSLRQASPLGNQIAELFFHEMQQFGFELVDLKNNEFIDSTQRGDFGFSRDNKRIAADGHFDHVLSGTLIYERRGVVVNTRITNVENNRVMASASAFIPQFVIQ